MLCANLNRNQAILICFTIDGEGEKFTTKENGKKHYIGYNYNRPVSGEDEEHPRSIQV